MTKRDGVLTIKTIKDLDTLAENLKEYLVPQFEHGYKMSIRVDIEELDLSSTADGLMEFAERTKSEVFNDRVELYPALTVTDIGVDYGLRSKDQFFDIKITGKDIELMERYRDIKFPEDVKTYIKGFSLQTTKEISGFILRKY